MKPEHVVDNVIILNFVNIVDGHIVVALAPDDDPEWIECIVHWKYNSHVIISKDLTKVLGVDWYMDGACDDGPNGTLVANTTSVQAICNQMPTLAKLVIEALQKL